MVSNPQLNFFSSQRSGMVEYQLRDRGISDERVLAAMEKVPRHEFVPADFQNSAYADTPIPISEGQTISQPYIVAYMLQVLGLHSLDKVLEIGTGSGYQTALLAELVSYVYSIERHQALAQQAIETLRLLGYQNFSVTVGDGTEGLASEAPFDAIIVSAAAPRIPETLFSQLKEGGRMVVPVGTTDAQAVELVQKQLNAPVVTYLEGCRFVPLVGREGFSSGH